MPNDMTSQTVELTQSGFDDLVQELNELKEVKLPAIIERVAKAREYGDLAENSEYHSARDDQQLIETRIEQIEDIIKKSVVVKQTKSSKKIGIGSVVTITKKDSKKTKKTVEICGEFQADPLENKISSASPMGKALIGKKKGDEAVIKAPAGTVTYIVEEIK